MKLRIRSVETKETVKIDAPDPCTLLDLKTLISVKLSSASSAPAHPPESIHLSLNRKDELLSPSPADTLHSLGVTSGDLLFFSLAHAQTLTLAPPIPAQTLTLAPLTPAVAPPPPAPLDSAATNPSPTLVTDQATETLGTEPPEDPMELDSELLATIKKSPSIPLFLKRVLEAEGGEIKTDSNRLVVAVHAIFLESGFAVASGTGRLPEGWASAAGAISVRYTVPDLVRQEGVEFAVLKFSALGKHASVYGFVGMDRPEFYRVSLDASMVPLLGSDEMGEKEEKDVFKLWKTVKDELVLPVLIDFCERNGLNLPPCFMRLPTELKIKILVSLPGVDVARVGCASSELKYLSSNFDDEVWRKKFVEEFGLSAERGAKGKNWKEKYAECWVRTRRVNKRRIAERESARGMQFGHRRFPRNDPFGPHRFPMIGGDYDRFPNIGGFGSRGPGSGFGYSLARMNFFSSQGDPSGHNFDYGTTAPRSGSLYFPGTRNMFSPPCDLDGHDGDFGL